MVKTSLTSLLLVVALFMLAGCTNLKNIVSSFHSPSPAPNASAAGKTTTPEKGSTKTASEQTSPGTTAEPAAPTTLPESADPSHRPSADQTPKPPATSNAANIQVAAQPESIAVLVNKRFGLPENYRPVDLVYPNVPFILPQKSEKRMMRKEAAVALVKLFAGAKKDGIFLSGVSAYRSHATQKALFAHYVEKDGVDKARTYSAVPGTSEHETGLAIDLTGKDGKCAAEDCFAGSEEALWLAKYAPDYGFIIRYPEGKETITGYQYEPWHLRYVGIKIAKEITAKGITLEEYLNAVPVSAPK